MKRPRAPKADLKAARKERVAKQDRAAKIRSGFRFVGGVEMPPGAILADWESLEHNNATIPDVAYPLFYADTPFQCRDCGSDEIWTAEQQKWWYEVAKGPIGSVAVRCRSCRHKERDRAAGVRALHLEGLARKSADRKP